MQNNLNNYLHNHFQKVGEIITTFQGGGGYPKWPKKGLRNICTVPNNFCNDLIYIVLMKSNYWFVIFEEHFPSDDHHNSHIIMLHVIRQIYTEDGQLWGNSAHNHSYIVQKSRSWVMKNMKKMLSNPTWWGAKAGHLCHSSKRGIMKENADKHQLQRKNTLTLMPRQGSTIPS